MTSRTDIPTLSASRTTAPPTWALLERKLIDLMGKGAAMMSEKYAERGGQWYWYDDLDDHYERSYNWGLLYNMGGGEHLVDLALKHWNASTRLFDDCDRNRADCIAYAEPPQCPQAQHPQRILQPGQSRRCRMAPHG